MSAVLRGLLAGVMIAGSTSASADDLLRGVLDGEQRQWRVLVAHGQSSAYFRDEGGYLEVTIQGHAGERFTTEGALIISMLAMDGELPGEAEVMHFPEPRMLPNFNNDGQAGELVLTRFATQGDQLRVTGRYQGTLRYVETLRPQGAPLRLMQVDVEFDLLVPRLED